MIEYLDIYRQPDPHHRGWPSRVVQIACCDGPKQDPKITAALIRADDLDDMLAPEFA